MPAPYKISVIIPCFNHGDFLSEAIASVTAMARRDIELIVVDDGSTDQLTLQKLQAVENTGVRVIRQENKGPAEARNVAIRNSSGLYILPLDADNRLRPAYVQHGVRILDRNPRVGVVFGDAQYIGIRGGRWYMGPLDRNRILHGNHIDACAVYRRTIWEQNGGYDTAFLLRGLEDWDFWLTTLENGWEFEYVREILFEYRVNECSMNTRALRFKPQATDLIARKHALLYREAFLRLKEERESFKKTALRCGKQLGFWVREKMYRLATKYRTP